MNKKIFKILTYVTLLLILASLSFALTPKFKFQRSLPADISVPCINNNTYCSSSAKCSITIIDPETIKIVNNASMTGNNGFYNYTLGNDYTNKIGEYLTTTVCDDNGQYGYSAFSFMVTDENVNYSNTMVIIIGLGIVIFILAYLSINFDQEHTLLRLLFIFFSIGMLPLIPKSIIWGQDSLTLFYKSTVWVMIIFFVYVFVYFAYYIFVKALLEKWHIIPKNKKSENEDER